METATLKELTKEVEEITEEVVEQRKKIMAILERANLVFGKGWGE